MKSIVLIMLLFVCFSAKALATVLPATADTTIPKTSLKKAALLSKFGNNDTCRALIEYWYGRRNFFGIVHPRLVVQEWQAPLYGYLETLTRAMPVIIITPGYNPLENLFFYFDLLAWTFTGYNFSPNLLVLSPQKTTPHT